MNTLSWVYFIGMGCAVVIGIILSISQGKFLKNNFNIEKK